MLANERYGSFRFYGEWFGGRAYENQHTLTSVHGDEHRLVLGFDEQETLTVDDPMGVLVVREELRIARASRVRWEWFAYGCAQTAENLYVLEYRAATDGEITVTDSTDSIHTPDPTADAVALLTPPG